MKYKGISCGHETSGIHPSKRLSDYHPLSEKQIKELLFEAAHESDEPMHQLNRLCQAIPGYECPQRMRGPVAKKENKIGILFVRGLSYVWDDDEIEEIIRLTRED